MLTQDDMLASLANQDIIKLDVRDVDERVGTSSSPYGFDFCPRKGHIGDSEDATEKPGHGTFFTTLLLILATEFGDKTQIAVAGLAGNMAAIPVGLARIGMMPVESLEPATQSTQSDLKRFLNQQCAPV